MPQSLNNTKSLESLQSDYFVRMMLPDAEKKVSRPERSVISNWADWMPMVEQ